MSDKKDSDADNPQDGVTRRELLKYGGLAGAAGLAGVGSISLQSEPAVALASGKPGISIDRLSPNTKYGVGPYDFQYRNLPTQDNIEISYIFEYEDGTSILLDNQNESNKFDQTITEPIRTTNPLSLTHELTVPDKIGSVALRLRIFHPSLGDIELPRSDNNLDYTTEIDEPLVLSGADTVSIFNDGTDDYLIHAFTDTAGGQLTVDNAPSDATVDVLVVGGGGGGGERASGTGGTGGGGAGGLVLAEGVDVDKPSYVVEVGPGGSGNSNGSDSSFDDLTALGGGAGKGGNQGSGNDGGSGGGTGQNNGGDGEQSSGLQPGTNDGTTLSVGNLRDLGEGSVPRDAPNDDGTSGGGGATQPGQTGEFSSGFTSENGYLDGEIPSGGDGFDASNLFGTQFGESGSFAGGGAAGVNYDSGSSLDSSDPEIQNPGGVGGGGDSGVNPSSSHSSEPAPEDGQANTGGGGGGLGSNDNARTFPSGTSGGSGIVLIRQKL